MFINKIKTYTIIAWLFKLKHIDNLKLIASFPVYTILLQCCCFKQLINKNLNSFGTLNSDLFFSGI